MSVDKVVDSAQLDADLTSIANAIRTKGGTSASLAFPSGFVTAIGNISTGITPTGTKNITISSSGTTTEDVTNYASAAITVGAGTAGTPTATKGTVSSHAISVTPSVTNSAGYISGGTKTGTAVSVSASELVSGTYSVTSSGTKDVTNYASASVPAGTEGTPTATKGTVSNHSVSVTPSVTNTTGFITGSTKTGTAVTVSASELVSGSQTVTQNGTVDVTNLASLIVNVTGGGGGGLEYETGTFTLASDIAWPNIGFTNTHTTLPFFALMVDTDGYLSTEGSNILWYFVNYEMLFGSGVYPSESVCRYGEARYQYRTSSATALTSSVSTITYPASTTGSSTGNYPRYWATETCIKPNSGNGSRYWRAERTYKWIAVWKP